MSPDDRVRVEHMVQYAEAVARLIEGHTREDLDREIALNLALERAIEVIGEAATHVSPECRSRIDLPWAKIVGMRHRLVHAYILVDQNVLWRTAAVEVPAILVTLRRALDDA